MSAIIQKVIRIKDDETFELGDPVQVDGIFQGIIVGFNKISDDMNVLLDDDSDDEEGIIYPINKIESFD